MEHWEAAHITKNLATLIKTTRCSAVLKARLKAKKLLNDEEDQRLTAIGRNEGSISEAKLLYEILTTRFKGYSGLVEVLLGDRQDGALKILLEGLQQPEAKVASAESITQVLNMKVQLANCTKRFNEVFPHFTSENAKDILQNGDVKPELKEIFRKGSLGIKLDGELPVTSDLYIPRLLSNRLQLDPRVFTLSSCEDVFVFTNIDIRELTQLVKPHAVRSSTHQRSVVAGRHIHLDDEEDWEDMVAISKSPIHLISKEDDKYILHRTTRVTDVLQNYGLREGLSQEAFVTEDAFLEELVSDNLSKGALICDVAGMGKTCLMRSLASKIREKNENFAVFYIDLPSFSKLLTAKDKPPDSQGLATLLNYACRSKLASHLLQKYAVESALKIVFVLDGYDELNRDDIEVVKSNLEDLSKLNHIRLIISSRPIMREFLQKSFNLISHDILPFQTEEQMRCLTEHWTNVCPQTDSASCKLEEFALQCIKSVKSIQNDDISEFLGVPLKCRILATVNEQQAKQLCKVTRQKPFQVVEAATIKSVFDLYTMFVDAMIDKVAGTLPLAARNDFVKGILTFFTHMALELLFPDLSIVYLQKKKMDTSMHELFTRVGVAWLNHDNQRLEFIHRSFAEYFVGRFFAEFWNDIDQFSPSLVQTVGSYFIRNVLIAVDGLLRIHPDQWCDAWEDLIKYEFWPSLNFDSWGDMELFQNFSLFLNFKKAYQLKYPLILLFMNMNLKVQKLQVLSLERPTNRFRNVATSFKTEDITTTQSLQPVNKNTNYGDALCELKKTLTKSSFATLTACIDERLTNIMTLYVQILMSFFDPEDRVALILPNTKDQNGRCTDGAAWLLCRAVFSKSPENAVELFNLFGDSEENFLSVLCQRYPEEYWSPLELAIINEDLDMIHYFVDKVSLPFNRLFDMCVATDQEMGEPDVDGKLKIMKMVFGSSDRVFHIFSMHSLCSYTQPAIKITKHSFPLLLKFLEDSKRSIRSITSENRRFILEKCVQDCNDKELVNLLLSLYGKGDDKKLAIVNLAAGRTFTAELVLDALDLVEVTKAFSKIQLFFKSISNCSNLETLKVLTAILPDFSCCNYEKWNYLHFAARNLNIDWVKHLVKSGHEVEQEDTYGDTPLLTASLTEKDPKSLLVVTRLLVENGANVYAKDREGRNIAHRVFISCRNPECADFSEWVSYFLENGYHQLWEMRDRNGETPQEMLVHVDWKNSPTTTNVLRLLESYSILNYSNAPITNSIYNWNEDIGIA